ncbi:MAG: glycosyltransferase family 39 protein [Deinococcales bacterium]|nr:glycosyltransferase family 39 protein [Chitinophagaceae bacterium]
MPETNYKKQLVYLILATVILKIIVASFVELGNDEVYYWTYALQPDYNHFDHPPLVGLLIRLTSLNLHWANDVSLRLGAIIGCAIASWFIFLTGKTIATERTGWYAALIYNCSVYTGIIAGLFILPDSPQMPIYTGALYIMCQLIFTQQEKKLLPWLWLGLLIGLACLCKVHGLYLWAGFGLFILFKRSKWLLNWRLYLGVIVTIICVLPIVYWNIDNDFITYKFHAERVTNTAIQWDMLLQEIVGEFLYQNPVVFILIIVSVIYFITHKKLFSATTNIWLLCMSVPMIVLFWVIALFNPTLPHWSGPAYIPLYFFAARYLEEKVQQTYPLFLKIATGLVVFVLVVGVAVVQLAPTNFGSKNTATYGEFCPTLDISGWKDFSNQFNTLVTIDIANNNMPPTAPILVGKWFPAGHLEFYTSRVTGLRILGIGNITDVHKFAWLNTVRQPLKLGDAAYCIVPSNIPFNVAEAYGQYFTTIEPPVTINQMRSGKVVRYFYVYRLRNCKLVPKPLLK